jgi:hypothetical protein
MATVQDQIAESVARTDRVTVYLLDPIGEAGDSGTFPLSPYGPEAKTGVHAASDLEKESVVQMLALWLDMLHDPEGRQAACHYPIHGLRFFRGNSVLYETSLCWLCNNYYGKLGNGYGWLGFPGQLPQGPPAPSCAAVRNLLERLMPIPESLARKAKDLQPRFKPGRGYGGGDGRGGNGNRRRN